MNRDELFLQPAVGRADYGRFELRRVLHRNYYLGFLISAVLHFTILGTYYFSRYLTADEDIPTVRIRKVVKYSDLGPPPSIQSVNTPPPIAIGAVAQKPSVGIPVPVPDAEVSPEQTIATQLEMSAEPSPAIEGLGGEEGLEILGDITIEEDEEPGMNDFVPVEKSPQIVRKVMPEYPEMAIRAGLEGTVWVKVLVDKDGKPVRAVVIKSTAEMFNDPAIAAAMGFLFTPAVMNNGPVKVWVSIPFRFQLKDVRVPS